MEPVSCWCVGGGVGGGKAQVRLPLRSASLRSTPARRGAAATKSRLAAAALRKPCAREGAQRDEESEEGNIMMSHLITLAAAALAAVLASGFSLSKATHTIQLAVAVGEVEGAGGRQARDGRRLVRFFALRVRALDLSFLCASRSRVFFSLACARERQTRLLWRALQRPWLRAPSDRLRVRVRVCAIDS